MKSVIYISHGHIHLMAYTKNGKNIKLDKLVCTDINPDAMINGVVIDRGEITEKLKTIYTENTQYCKNVQLVINSSGMVLKPINAPNLRKSQYLRLVREDLKDRGDFEEMIFGFARVKNSLKKPVLMGCGTSRIMFETYIEMFKDAGIEVNSVKMGVDVLADYFVNQPKYNGRTFVVNMSDGISRLSIIFDKNIPVFMSRGRLLAEGVQAKADYWIEEMSQLLQFCKSQNLPDLTDSCYIGVEPEVVDIIKQYTFTSKIELSLQDFKKDVLGGNSIDSEDSMLVMAAMAKKNHLDVMRFYKQTLKAEQRVEKEEQTKKQKTVLWYVSLALVVAVAYLGLFLMSWYEDNMTMRYNGVILEYEENRQAMNEMQTKVDILKARVEGIGKYRSGKVAMPRIDAEVMNFLLNQAQGIGPVTAMEYEHLSSRVNLSIVGVSQESAADYATRIRKSDKIDAVEYSGYTLDGAGQYSFTVIVTLKNQEG